MLETTKTGKSFIVRCCRSPQNVVGDMPVTTANDPRVKGILGEWTWWARVNADFQHARVGIANASKGISKLLSMKKSS